MIRVRCPNCSSMFDTDDIYAGKTATCLNCQARFVIPTALSSNAAKVQRSHMVKTTVQIQPQGQSGVSIAGFVCGIVSLVLSFIPCIGLFSLGPAIAGLICSIIGLAQAKKKNQKKGLAIAGLVCSCLALIWVPLFVLVIMGSAGAALSLPSFMRY